MGRGAVPNDGRETLLPPAGLQTHVPSRPSHAGEAVETEASNERGELQLLLSHGRNDRADDLLSANRTYATSAVCRNRLIVAQQVIFALAELHWRGRAA